VAAFQKPGSPLVRHHRSRIADWSVGGGDEGIAALKEVLPYSKVIREETHPDKGFLIIRPDSGDPVEAVLEGLVALEKVYGVTVNGKGFKVINNAGIIQGDGINIHVRNLRFQFASVSVPLLFQHSARVAAVCPISVLSLMHVRWVAH
jgi:hypothetical protein